MSRELLESYQSNAGVNTIIEIVSEEKLRESLPGCVHIQDILQSLSRAAKESPQPKVLRELALPPEFATQFPATRYNEYRGSTVPRFLVVDLDSFKSVIVDCEGVEKQTARDDRARGEENEQ